MMIIVMGIVLFFFLSIAMRFFVRQVLIVRLGVENQFTDAVFFDSPAMATTENTQTTTFGETDDYSIDWAVQYPFDDVSINETYVVSKDDEDSILDSYTSVADEIKGSIEQYAQKNLIGYSLFAELSNQYEKLIGWNFTSYNEYNGIFQMEDGYWTSLKPKINMEEHVTSLSGLYKLCETQGIDFLYVQAPFKVSKYDDSSVSGQLDFSNQNADELLAGLDTRNIQYLDLRDSIYQEGLNHHSLFYVTDHHWKPETGLWAAQKICDFINQEYEGTIDTSGLQPDNFTSKVYEEWFLGSYGKKVTLGKAKPEDFSLLYPNEKTLFHYVIPSLGIDSEGDFSITYNMETVEPQDYYNKSPYAAYNYGDRAVIQIENLLEAEDRKILFVHDSFADSVIPFMALGIQSIDSIDLRYFTGSLESYIEESEPDMVIVMYNAGEVSEDVEYLTHTDLFDFR